MDIMTYCEKIITGVGGLHDFERYELAVPNVDRDVATAAWVIRCLANPKSEGSQQVLEAILERRRELSSNEAKTPVSAEA